MKQTTIIAITLFLFMSCALKAQDTLCFFMSKLEGEFLSLEARPSYKFLDLSQQVKIDSNYSGVVYISHEKLPFQGCCGEIKYFQDIYYSLKDGEIISEKTYWYKIVEKSKLSGSGVTLKVKRFKLVERHDSLEIVSTLHPNGTKLVSRRTDFTKNKPYRITELIDSRFGEFTLTIIIKTDSSEHRETFSCLNQSCSAYYGSPFSKVIKTFNKNHHHTRKWEGEYLMFEEINKFGEDTFKIEKYWKFSSEDNYILDFYVKLKNDKHHGDYIVSVNDTTSWKTKYSEGKLINIKNDSVLFLNTKLKQISKDKYIEIVNTHTWEDKLRFDEIVLIEEDQVLTGRRYKYLFYIFKDTYPFRGEKGEKKLKRVLKRAD